MNALIAIFVADILPVFAIALVGFLLARYLGASVKTLSHVVFYAALPCLAFRLVVSASLAAPALGLVVSVAVIVAVGMGAMGYLTATILRLDRPSTRAFLLVVMFSNAGNYGLPVVQFAFGNEALAYAAVYFLTGSVLTYTLGGFLAAGARAGTRSAPLRVLKMPALYGVTAGLVVLAVGAVVPTPIMRPVSLLADAALPIMILILGMQLERAAKPERPMAVAAATALSLAVAPILALAVTTSLGVTGPAKQAVVTLASMPVAVATTILALEFDLDANFVTSAVVVSTLVSPFTLTLLIAYLR